MPGVYGRFTQSYEKEGANQKISFAKTKQRLQKNAIRALRALPYKNIHMKEAEQPRSRAAIRAPTASSAPDQSRICTQVCTLVALWDPCSPLRQNLDVKTPTVTSGKRRGPQASSSPQLLFFVFLPNS